jgi:hypothetical protein
MQALQLYEEEQSRQYFAHAWHWLLTSEYPGKQLWQFVNEMHCRQPIGHLTQFINGARKCCISHWEQEVGVAQTKQLLVHWKVLTLNKKRKKSISTWSL